MAKRRFEGEQKPIGEASERSRIDRSVPISIKGKVRGIDGGGEGVHSKGPNPRADTREVEAPKILTDSRYPRMATTGHQIGRKAFNHLPGGGIAKEPDVILGNAKGGGAPKLGSSDHEVAAIGRDCDVRVRNLRIFPEYRLAFDASKDPKIRRMGKPLHVPDSSKLFVCNE